MKIYSSKTKSWSESEEKNPRRRRVASCDDTSEGADEMSEGISGADERSEMNTRSGKTSTSTSSKKWPTRPGRSEIGAADEIEEGVGDVQVDADVEGLVFDPQDVADLLAEVTGEDIEAEVADDGDAVTFRVGEDEYEVQADESTEILEAHSVSKSKKDVKAAKATKPVKASSGTPRGRVVRTIKK